MMRTCAALLLGLAFVGAPVITNYCAVSCDAAQMGRPSASPAHAGHHHGSPARFSINQPAQPCGHDHNAIVGVAARPDDAPVDALAPAAAVMPASPVTPPGSLSARVTDGSSSPPEPALRGFAAAIRI